MVRSDQYTPGMARWTDAMRRVGLPEAVVDKVILATLPESNSNGDLVTLNEASAEYQIPLGTLKRWVHVGHLVVQDRIKWPGGGKILVDKADVERLKDNRPKIGRPITTGAGLLRKR